MGMLDTPDDEEESNSNDGESGTYIQFISGPGHRDWKESWSDEAKNEISAAYQAAAPEANGAVAQYGSAMADDRQHFYAKVTLCLKAIFEDHDFQPMLDLLMGDPEEGTEDLYAHEIAAFLDDNPEIGEVLAERLREAQEA